jgi:gas vesicle protein
MTTRTKIALGVAGAAAAGIIIGLLIAPEKGSDMRRKVKRKATDWADSLSNLFVRGKHAVEDLENKSRSAKSAAEEKVSKLKESLV